MCPLANHRATIPRLFVTVTLQGSAEVAAGSSRLEPQEQAVAVRQARREPLALQAQPQRRAERAQAGAELEGPAAPQEQQKLEGAVP